MNQSVFVKRSIRPLFFPAIFPVLLFFFLFVINANAEPDSTQQDTPPAEINVEVVHLKTVKLNTVGIKLYPKEVLQGEIYQEKGNYKKAEKLYQQALDKYAPPGSAFVTVGHLMQLYQTGGDLAEVDKDLAAKVLSEDAFIALKHLVQLYVETKDLAKAEKTINEIMNRYSLNSRIAELGFSVAAYYANQNYEKARYILEKIVNNYQQNDAITIESLYLLGSILCNMGSSEEAIKYYERGLLLAPNYMFASSARHNISVMYIKMGKTAEAKKYYQKTIEVCPETSDEEFALYKLGEMNYLEKNWEETIKNFEDLVKKFPSSDKKPMVLRFLGEAYENTSKLSSAYQAYLKIIKEYPAENDYVKYAKQRLEILGLEYPGRWGQ